MDEVEWILSNSAAPILGHLKGRASDRKLLLFAAAVCRTSLGGRGAKREVMYAAAEAFADGEATVEDVRTAAAIQCV